MECCRLCSVKEKLLDVFDSRFQNGGEVVRTYIYLCSGVEILATDMVSKKICQQCLDQILFMFKFRTKAGLNDRKQKKDAGLEVEKMKPVPAIIKNNLDMLKKISNTIIKVNGVSDIIIIDDDDCQIQSDIIAAPNRDLNPIQENNVTNNPVEDLLGIVASTSGTTDNELATDTADKIQSNETEDVAISNGELATASTSLQNGPCKNNNNEGSNVDHSKDMVSTLPSNNIDEVGDSQLDDSLLLKNNQKETELNSEESQTQVDNTICDENQLQNDTERNGSNLKKLDNSIADVKTNNVDCKTKKKNNSSSKRKSNKSIASNKASSSKEVNISISDRIKTKNADGSTNKIDVSMSDGQKTTDVDGNANKSKNGDGSSINQMEISISDAKKPNIADTNCSKQMHNSVSGGKKTKSVSKDLKGQKHRDFDQNKTIDSCEKSEEHSKNTKIEALKCWVPSKSIISILKKYPKLIISENLLGLNISPTISLRRCDEKTTQRNVRKRINSPVALTRARKRLRGSLPAESPFKRLEANSHINNMEEKKEMFVSSLELVSKDKIQDPASQSIAESKLITCINCSEKFKSNNSLKIHKRSQCCKWCKECFNCSIVKYKHENFECKFRKKLVVEIEKMNDELTSLPTEPLRAIDIDVEISLKEYILNKMTMTKEKMIQTEKMNIEPEQPTVEGNKIRYRDLYRDIVSSYMPVHLCLSTKTKSTIVRTNLQPHTSVKQPVTEVKKTRYEKKTQQQINDILFHTSKSPQSNESSSNKSAASVVKQLVPTVVSSQQQTNTAVNSKSVNSSVIHQQIIIPINNQQINLPVLRSAVNQELINNQKINVSVIKPQENPQSTAVINKQQVNIPVIKPLENQQLTALINNQPTQIPAVNQQIAISNHHINLSSFRPSVNQQLTIPINNQQINLGPVVSQHMALPLNNLAVSQHLKIPVSNSALSLRHTNPSLNSLLSTPLNPTVLSRQYSACGFQCGNASKTVVNTNNTVNTRNTVYLNQLQLNANRMARTSAPKVLNSKMAQPTNIRQSHHLSTKVSNNETASKSRRTASKARNMEVLNSRTTGNMQNPYGGQSSSPTVTVLQTEKGPITQQIYKLIEKIDASNEKSNDNPVILNGSRSVSNKIWVKNPMEINKSANM